MGQDDAAFPGVALGPDGDPIKLATNDYRLEGRDKAVWLAGHYWGERDTASEAECDQEQVEEAHEELRRYAAHLEELLGIRRPDGTYDETRTREVLTTFRSADDLPAAPSTPGRRVMDPNVSEEAMAAELRRRGFVVVPPALVERAEHEFPGFLDIMLGSRDDDEAGEEPSDA
jgi:hypothetical protein